MRNVFDQYGQSGSRLTYALFVVLNEDELLLNSFIQDICIIYRPAKAPKETVSVQTYPDGTEYSDDETLNSRILDSCHEAHRALRNH